MAKKLTPAQQQYHDLKEQHSDAILFFRLGDFYEMFHDDAHIAHKELDITLTARDKTSENPIPMAGVPHHSAEKYIKKLVQAWYKVAIAEQTTAAIPGKIVEREVVQVITPWTDIEEDIHFNYIIACSHGGASEAQYHVAWWDVSLGEYITKSFTSLDGLLTQIAHLQAREIVVDIHFPEREQLKTFAEQEHILCSIRDLPHDVSMYLQHLLGTSSLSGYGKALESWRSEAFALLLWYVEEVQKKAVQSFAHVRYESSDDLVMLDDITIRNLELFRSSYSGSTEQSLYGVINSTVTPMWARLLYDRLAHPIHNLALLKERQWHVSYFAD